MQGHNYREEKKHWGQLGGSGTLMNKADIVPTLKDFIVYKGKLIPNQ